MIFLDGVGIGSRDASVNPFFVAKLPTLSSILSGEPPSLRRRRIQTHHSSLVPLDATLGIPGFPQSGTGQTALFTGENGARIIGKHFGPHPYSTLRPVIARKNIFQQLLQQGKNPGFGNAYPKRFFEYVERHPTRLTVTTYACLQTGIPLRRDTDLAAGKAVSGDITGAGWRVIGYPEMEVIEPPEAGRRLVGLLEDHDFVLFEYWRTDKAGHSRHMKEAVGALEQVDQLLAGVLDTMDLRRDLLLITSDHGNLEDLSTKTHTRHPVPAILYGHRHMDLAAKLDNQGRRRPGLCDVTPALVSLLTDDG
jgi:2,3-bisphosphoglycerate-independent phosphoglycerate mutase